MCRVLKEPKSTHYHSFHKKPNVYEVENQKITERICAIHKESGGRYIHAQLQKEGVKVSIKCVQRLMKKAGIRSNITKKYLPPPTQKPVEERENVLE